jgi:spermidine/putrescine transport system permease protein
MKFIQRPPTTELPFAIGAPAMVWQVCFFYLPLAILAISSFIHFSPSGLFERLTFEKVLFFFQPVYWKVIFSSFLLAISNALLCLCIGYPLAYFLAFTKKSYRALFLFLLIVPFWTNFLLHTYAWFFVLERGGIVNTLLTYLHLINEPIGFLNTPFAIMVMMVYYYLPFMVMPLYSTLERIDTRLVEASLDLGATWGQTIKRVIIPLSKKGLKAGFFLVYIPSFGEFAIPELMGGDKWMFVGTVVSHYILGDQTGSLGAAFTLLSCLFLLVSALCLYFLIDRFIPGRSSDEKR